MKLFLTTGSLGKVLPITGHAPITGQEEVKVPQGPENNGLF